MLSRVLLVDGGSLFRHSVQQVFEGEPDLHVVAATDDPRAAVEDAAQTRPDIVLLDADLVLSELASLVGRIKREAPDCKVLVITSSDEMGPLVEAMEAGASGYLTKSASIWDLLDATRSVCRGDVVIPPPMLGTLVAVLTGRRSLRGETTARLSRLTRREREVLVLLGDGYDKNAIAAALVISPQTARTHIQNILTKLGVHSQLEAAAFARSQLVAHQLGSVVHTSAEDGDRAHRLERPGLSTPLDRV